MLDLGEDDPVALVGHSMGGKISMLVALRHPELVERLVVVDVAPVPYDHASEFDGYIKAMRAIDLDALKGRSDAEDALREAVPNPTVRGFLLQSLRRDGDHWRWYLNLELLGRDLDAITDWPEAELAGTAPYDGPVLWVGGADSAYVHADYAAAMDRWFPRNRRVTIKGAGHWVHSEQPEVFVEVLRRFLDPVSYGTSAVGRGRPPRRCGCRRSSSRSAGTGCGRGRAPRRRRCRRRRPRAGTSRRSG